MTRVPSRHSRQTVAEQCGRGHCVWLGIREELLAGHVLLLEFS